MGLKIITEVIRNVSEILTAAGTGAIIGVGEAVSAVLEQRINAVARLLQKKSEAAFQQLDTSLQVMGAYNRGIGTAADKIDRATDVLIQLAKPSIPVERLAHDGFTFRSDDGRKFVVREVHDADQPASTDEASAPGVKHGPATGAPNGAEAFGGKPDPAGPGVPHASVSTPGSIGGGALTG